MKLRTLLTAIAVTTLITACGGTDTTVPDGYQPAEPSQTQTQGLSGVYTSPVIGAFDGVTPTSLELPYGPSTGLCAPVYLSGSWATQTVSDFTGAASTSIVRTIAADGNYVITARIQNAGDEILTAFQCLPWSAFSRGVPTRSGWDGIETQSTAGATEDSENPWTAFFVPMSFWGNSVGPHFVPNNIMPPGVWVSGGFAGVSLNSGTLAGAARAAASGDVTAVQYEGFSWSPTTCSYTLGRHSSGSCIYVPNGENAGLSPASSCDFCTYRSEEHAGTNGTCSPNANATQCPGTNNKFCFISQVFGSFDKSTGATGTIGLDNTVSPTVVNFFSSSSSAPAPGGTISCIETAI